MLVNNLSLAYLDKIREKNIKILPFCWAVRLWTAEINTEIKILKITSLYVSKLVRAKL